MDNNSYPSSFPKRNGPTKTIAVAHQLHPAGFQRHNQVASAAINNKDGTDPDSAGIGRGRVLL
jgi:hypothetical protein